jgi:hypothetical protein
MRLEQLATRLSILESKVSFLMTGEYTTPASTDNVTAMDIDARLTLVETTVDMLVAQKTQEVMATIATADSSDGTTPSVDAIVALSPSATFPEASDIVNAVVQSQVELPAIESETAAAAVATAVATVVTAQPEVVTDADKMTDTILDAIADQPAVPAGTEADQAVEAVSAIIASVTGEEITEEVKAQITEAVTSEPDSALDAIEARLDAVEAKYNTLVK